MTVPSPDRIAAARRALETTYGLSLQSLGEGQLALALALVEDGHVLDPSEPASLERILDQLPIDESWLFRDDDLWSWIEDDLGKTLLELWRPDPRPAG